METVVVTGVRASLATAADIKRNSSQFMDAIVAEDIGKLPDNTIIDAMEHITGVQVQHTSGAGETDTFLIHGLPDVATTVNGREIFTTIGRYISLADVPAELLSRVDIHKSAQADDLEGGIAGLINAVFHRPFDFEGMEVGGGLKGVYGTQAGHVDPDASLLFSNRWKTSLGEMGLLVDVSYNKRHFLDYDAFNYWFGGTSTLNGVTAHTPETTGAIEYPGSRERAGLNASYQWRPNSNLEIYAEAFYTRFRSATEANYLVGYPNKGSSVSDMTTVTDPDGIVIMKSETATASTELSESRVYHNSSDTFQLATGATWTGENLTLSAEVDYTDSRYKNRGFWFDQLFDGMFSFDTNYQKSGTPNITLASTNTFDMMQESDYHIVQFWDAWTKQSGNEIDLKTDGSYKVGEGFLKEIDFGFRYANRFGKSRGGQLQINCFNSANGVSLSSQTHDQLVAAARSAGCGYVNDNLTAWWGVNVASILPGSMKKSSGNFLDGEVPWGVKNWMVVSSDYAFANIQKIRALYGQDVNGPGEDPSNSFDDREQSYAGYVKLDYGMDVSGMPLTGNVGLRVVDTRALMRANSLTISGTTVNGSTVYSFIYDPVTSRKEVVDWMPSFNAKLEVSDDMVVRLATSRTVSRPTFAQLNPAMSLYSGATFTDLGTSGNPNLSPIKSNNVDLGWEYYFNNQDNVTATVFYRQIVGYVQSTTVPQVINGTTYTITKPNNGGQGYLQGLELGYTQFYDFLPGIWSGLGFQANGTFIEGRTESSATSGIKIPYTNVSKYSYNLIGMYEKGPVSFRAAYNWRSSFLVDTSLADATSVQPSSAYAMPYGTLDLSASYRFEDTGLTLMFNATNLTHEIYRDSFGKGSYSAIYPRDTRTFDQTFELGLRYRM